VESPPDHALVVINCVALTDTLLENELFGHERGAFTGADRLQKSKLEMADGGTVFLDEIGDMSLPLQAILLRVLQDREFHRVGGTKAVSINIRIIIAATNKDLKQAVAVGDFREDLFLRLNVISLVLPPLRERRDDIPALAKFFLNRHAKEAKRPGMLSSPAAMDAMIRYSWPGNIREVENVIARAVVLSQTETLEPESSLWMVRAIPNQDRHFPMWTFLTTRRRKPTAAPSSDAHWTMPTATRPRPRTDYASNGPISRA
jgi:transcriptional regulator with GAF, ATPase, and Fis domain